MSLSLVHILATSLTLIGTILVGMGLYRRDPAAQRLLQRAWGWFRTTILRRSMHESVGSATARVAVSASAEGMRPPLAADPSMSLPDRVGRLEENIEILSGTIQTQARARREGDRALAATIDAATAGLRDQLAEVRRLADEASVPERAEWWGLAFLVLGSAVATLGG
jgi:hypothetical protein